MGETVEGSGCVYFEVLSHSFSEGTEKSHENNQREQPVPRQRLGPGTSRIQVLRNIYEYISFYVCFVK
jgi:hypothetical protein